MWLCVFFFFKRVDKRRFVYMFCGVDCYVGNLVMGDLGVGRKYFWG